MTPLLAVVPWMLSLVPSHAATTLIRGGTLIDGTGKAPVPNVRILIEGDVIQRVWSGDSGGVSIPADTRIIDAAGRFIIPGLIDSHIHFNGYMGELFLVHGVTTVYDLGGGSLYWNTAIQKGVRSGQLRGPRYYFCSRVGVGRTGVGDGGALNARWLSSVQSPADARQAVAAMKGKTDCIKLDETWKADLFSAVAREADAAGMAVISHSLNAADSVAWGIDGIEHMTGVALATIRSPEGRKAAEAMTVEAGHKNSLLYQWMEPAYFDELIQSMVRANVFLNPTLDFEWKGIIDRTAEFEVEDAGLLNRPSLQYVPLDERLVTLGQYHWADAKSSAEREQYRKGYRNVQEFVRRFVKAGGKLYSGTDSAAANTPGLSLHHEMQLYVDAGLSPMEALLSSTRWAAEVLRLESQVGTVEAGKLADLVILRSNPLDDIRNTKAIESVIQGGKTLDISYHSDYEFPFPLRGPVSKHLYNQVPVLRDVHPGVAVQGSAVRIRLLGQGFSPNSVALFNGAPVGTQWSSATEITAMLDAKHTAQPGSFLITVQSPKPGGGASEAIEFIVDFP
jgi:hypothetical protein